MIQHCHGEARPFSTYTAQLTASAAYTGWGNWRGWTWWKGSVSQSGARGPQTVHVFAFSWGGLWGSGQETLVWGLLFASRNLYLCRVSFTLQLVNDGTKAPFTSLFFCFLCLRLIVPVHSYTLNPVTAGSFEGHYVMIDGQRSMLRRCSKTTIIW